MINDGPFGGELSENEALAPSVTSAEAGSMAKVASIVMPAAFLMHFDRQMMVVLSPVLQNAFGLDLQTMTRIVAVSALTYGLFQLPGAWLATRLGPLRTISLSVTAWSCSVLCVPLAVTPITLMSLRALLGLCQAPDWLSSILVMEDGIPKRFRSRGSAGLLGSAYVGASLSGPVSVSLALRYGWHAPFTAVGVLGLVFGLALCFHTFTRATANTERNPSLEKDLQIDSQAGSAFYIASAAIAYFLFSGVQSFVYVLLPSFLTQNRNIPISAVGWLASGPFIALYLFVIIGGVLADHIFRKTHSVFLARVPLGSASLLGSGLCFASAILSGTAVGVMIFTTAGMALVGIGQVSLWSTVQDLTKGKTGSPAAWVQTMGALGLWLTPLIAVKFTSLFRSWRPVSLLFLGLGIAAALFIWLAQPSRSSAREFLEA